jgi:hypothetical protein
MLHRLSHDPRLNIKTVINTPLATDEIVTAGDKLFTSLKLAEQNAQAILFHIERMKIMRL